VASGGGAGGTGQGSPGNAGVGGADALKQGVSQDGSGGGSSPLVPILIAIAVLAAGSVGVFVMRQRRQRTGAFSPEVG
jgi:hypothetical protein